MSNDSDLDRALMKIVRRALRPLESSVASITESLSKLRDALAALPDRILGKTSNLREQLEAMGAALVAERAKADELAASEDAEDVAQNADLQAARDEVDRLAGVLSDATQEIDAAAAEVGEIAADPQAGLDDAPADPAAGDGEPGDGEAGDGEAGDGELAGAEGEQTPVEPVETTGEDQTS